MASYKMTYYGKGYDHFEHIANLAEAKPKAMDWLAKHSEGSVEVTSRGDRLIYTFFKDSFTRRIVNTHEQRGYLVGVNTTWPFLWASDLTSARILACKFMKKNKLNGISIYTPESGGFKDVGWILTNGSRFEYSNGQKMFTLNPDTGRISKY